MDSFAKAIAEYLGVQNGYCSGYDGFGLYPSETNQEILFIAECNSPLIAARLESVCKNKKKVKQFVDELGMREVLKYCGIPHKKEAMLFEI